MSSVEELRRSIDDRAPGVASPPGREVGEGRGGAVIAIAVVVVLAAVLAAILLIPGLLDWILSIGIWLLFLLLVVAVLGALVVAVLTVGVGIFYLSKPVERQGSEASYTLDMVKEPPKGNV